ncbi:MAG: cytochrome c oxidase assembly protein [Ktedonobacterales bacterium]
MDLQTAVTTWSFEPLVLLGIIAGALLYVRGLDYSARRGIGPRIAWWQVVAYFAGLFAILIGLESVVDVDAGKLLWVHMVQHDLLTLIGPPLLLLGAPLWPVWRGVPRQLRRWLLGGMIRTRWLWRAVGSVQRAFGDPRVALGLFLGMFAVWHLPQLYDAALTHPVVHIVEHLCFLATALLFFARIIPPDGALKLKHGQLGYAKRAVYLCIAAVALNVLGETFIFSTAPFYPYYVGLPRTPDMPTALVDQHLAGAAMSVPGALVFFAAVMWALTRWVREDELAGAAEEREEQRRQRRREASGLAGRPLP